MVWKHKATSNLMIEADKVKLPLKHLLKALFTLNVKRLERLVISDLLISICWLMALFTLNVKRLKRFVIPYLLIWMCWLTALLTLNVKRLDRLAIPNLLIWMCWLKALFTLNAKRLERLVRADLLIWMCFYRWRADDAQVFHMKLSFLEVFCNQVQPWNLDRVEN